MISLFSPIVDQANSARKARGPRAGVLPHRRGGGDDFVPAWMRRRGRAWRVSAARRRRWRVSVTILPTLYDQRYTHHQEATVTLGNMGYKMLSPIGRSIKVSEAMLQRVPLEEWDKNNPRVNEFATVAKEVIQWLKANQ